MKKSPEPKKDLPKRLLHPGIRKRAEAPWRSVLLSMTHDELVEAALSAAWEIKALNADIDRLWNKVMSDAEARRKAPLARLAKDEKQKAKAEIKAIWMDRRKTVASSDWRASVFAREMWHRFSQIDEFRTLQRWVKAWDDEFIRRDHENDELSSAEVEIKERWQARPEIHRILNYFPKRSFFQVP